MSRMKSQQLISSSTAVRFHPPIEIGGLPAHSHKASIIAKEAIQAEEDAHIFEAISRVMVPAGSVWVKKEEVLGRIFSRDMPITMETLKAMEGK